MPGLRLHMASTGKVQSRDCKFFRPSRQMWKEKSSIPQTSSTQSMVLSNIASLMWARHVAPRTSSSGLTSPRPRIPHPHPRHLSCSRTKCFPQMSNSPLSAYDPSVKDLIVWGLIWLLHANTPTCPLLSDPFLPCADPQRCGWLTLTREFH